MKTLNFEQMETVSGGGWWSDWGADAAAWALCTVGPYAALSIPGPGALISLGIKVGCATAGALVVIDKALS